MKTLRLFLLACVVALLGSPAFAQTVNLLVTDGNLSETPAGQPANPGSIQVTRTGSTASALTVWVKIKGTATQNVDYRLGNSAAGVSSFVVIPAGSAVLNIPIVPIDDFLTEGTETIRFELNDETSAGVKPPYTIGDNDKVELNLLDDEDPALAPRAIVSISVVDPQGAETAANAANGAIAPGTNPAIFRVSRSNNLNVALEVRYTLGGTATPGEDYTTPPATISIPAGVPFKDVVITPIDDLLVEKPETVVLTLQPHPSAGNVPPPPEAYVLGAATTATVEILSNDVAPPPTVAITSPANGITITSPAAKPISIPITFTASDPDGYITAYKIFDGTRVLTSGTINYFVAPKPGTPYSGSFTLENAYGGTHSFRVQVTDDTGVSASSPAVTVTTVYTYPVMSVTAVDAEAAERGPGETPNPAVFAITVDAPMPTDQYVFYRLTSPGPGLDFVPPPGYHLDNWPINIFDGPTDYGVALFPAGKTRVEIEVTPVDDLFLEGPEKLTMSLFYPFVINEQTFAGIVQVNEGGLHVDPNAVPVVNFQYEIGPDRTAFATILDNDTVPAPFSIVTIAATDADAQETPAGAPANPGVFTIKRDGPTTLPLTVNFAVTAPPRPTVIAPAVAPAQNGIDYVKIGNSVTIPAGASSAEIVISPIYDLLAEPVELVNITLRPPTTPLPDPSSYMLGAETTASLLIRDAKLPDGTPVVSIAVTDSQAYESAAPSRTGAFVVRRTGSLTEPLTVRYSIGGSATNGKDYVALPGTVTIPADSASAPIIIDPSDDDLEEGIESVALTLQPPPLDVDPPAYVLGASTALQRSAGVSIRDFYLPPLNRFERALRLRFPDRFVVIARPDLPGANGAGVAAPAASPGLAASPAPITWVVEASTDLVNWAEIGTVESSEEVDEFVDVDAGNYDARFYRFSPLAPDTSD